MHATTFDGRTTAAFDLAAAQARTAQSPFAWIDISSSGPGDADARALLVALGFSPAAATLALRSDVSGAFAGTLTGVQGVTWMATTSPPLAELHFSWEPSRLLTVRLGGDQEIARVQHAMSVRSTSLFEHPPSVLGVFLQMVLSGIDVQLTALISQVGALDERILLQTHPAQLTELRAVRATSQGLSLRLPRYADAVDAALVDAGALPGMDVPGAEHLRSYGTQLRDTIQRMHGLDLDLRTALQDYQTQVGNTQGDRINQLTVVSILFLPVTFLTGYFGMNFQWLDNQLMTLGTWAILGVILPILMVVGSAWFLARRGYPLGLRRRHPAEDQTASDPTTADPTAVDPATVDPTG